MEGFSKVLLVLVLSLSCLFFVGMEAQASGTGHTVVNASSVDFTGLNVRSIPAYPPASTVTGTLSTSGTSTGSVSNSGSIINYAGYFYTGSTLASYIDTTYGLSFDSFSALYTNSRYNGSTSVSLQSGTLYRCTGTNRDGVVVDCVCSGTSLNAYVYEFATAQVGSSASSSSAATNKDSGTFSGTFIDNSSSRNVSFYVYLNFDSDLPLEIGKEYDFAAQFYIDPYMTISSASSGVGSITVFPDVYAFNSVPFSDMHAVLTNNLMIVKGSYTPVEDYSMFSFTFSFDLPVGYSLSSSGGFLHYPVPGYPNRSFSFQAIESEQSIISDSLTSFPGSGALDASKGELDSVISGYDKVEGSLFDSGQAAFDKFDPSSLLTFSTGIYASIAAISQLMVGIITAMGEFSVIYTVGFVLVFFGMLIGLWRFFVDD